MAGTFSEDEIRVRIYGSKIVVVSEQAMLNVIYLIKVCMLIMYTRLTLGLTAQKAVRYLAYYVAVGWVATEIAFFTACRPFPGYWAMPPPDPQCTTLEHYAIVQGCFNISSDLLMLFIPLPLVIRMSMPWRHKVVLVFIFSMGLFVIVAALLTKIFNLTDIWDPTYMLWYCREASVAVYVSNLPMVWPLLREWFPCLRLLTPHPGTSEGSRKKSGATPTIGSVSKAAPSRRLSRMRPRRDSAESSFDDSAYHVDIEMKAGVGGGAGGGGRKVRIQEASSSTEEIVRAESSETERAAQHGGIHVTVERTVTVKEELRPTPRFDVQNGIFDWDHMGRSDHQFKIASKSQK